MKAKVIATGQIVEVKEWRGGSDVVYSTPDMNHFYQESDLDFNISDNLETTIGWVARDKDGTLLVHAEEPYRAKSGYNKEPDVWESDCASFLPIDKVMFAHLTWDSEPLQVKINLTPIQK